MDRANKMRGWVARINLSIKRVFYGVLIDNRVVKRARMPLVSSLVPLGSAYLLAREFFWDEWAFFYHHPVLHHWVTVGIVISIVVMALLKWGGDSYQFSHEGDYIDRLHQMLHMNSNIVNVKKLRFQDAAVKVSATPDIFLKITQPKDQINTILMEAENFLFRSFKLDMMDNVRITILEQTPDTREVWQYGFDTRNQWSQTPAEDLMAQQSTAMDCLQHGEPRYHPDKYFASTQGKYHWSDRDERQYFPIRK